MYETGSAFEEIFGFENLSFVLGFVAMLKL